MFDIFAFIIVCWLAYEFARNTVIAARGLIEGVEIELADRELQPRKSRAIFKRAKRSNPVSFGLRKAEPPVKILIKVVDDDSEQMKKFDW